MMKKILILSLFSACLVFAQADQFRMLQSNLISGLIPDIEDGYGVTFRDLNEDGYPDIYLVCFRNMNRLLVNNGGIIPFIDRTVISGLGGDLSSRGESNLELGSSCADFNNDGLPDIVLTGWGKTLKLFQNQGQFRFADMTATIELQGMADANQALWLDANNDGFLDIFITDEHHGNRLFINNRTDRFQETPWSEGFVDSSVSQGAVAADFDKDGDTDIYVANWHSADMLLLNNGEGSFLKARLDLPTLMQNSSSNSAAIGDINNDGTLDLLVAGHGGRVFVYRNFSDARDMSFYSDTTHAFYRISNPVYGILLEDFNQDGWLDVFLAVREGSNRLYLNDGNGGFQDEFDTDGQKGYSTGCAAADIDADGDLDIFVANKNSLGQVYLNPVNDKKYIKIQLTGVVSNRDALGAKVYLYSIRDTLRQLAGYREVSVQTGYLSSKEPQLYFGVNEQFLYEAEIFFPSGKVIKENDLVPGHTYQFYEYGMLIRAGYKLLYLLQFHLTRLGSWLNGFLFLTLLALIYTYIKLGIPRYQWRPLEIATQLFIWFTLALFSFIALRDQQAFIILLTLNGVSLSSVFLSILYSEQQLSLRKRRRRFRGQVQALSSRMINIHEDDVLYQDVRETILSHDDIRQVHILIYDPLNKIFVHQDNSSIKLTIQFKDVSILLKADILHLSDYSELHYIFSELKVNSLFPVKRENELYALVGLQMDRYHSGVNREDLQLLLPLINQVAIAIENNSYIQESAHLVRELTEARTKEKYVNALEETNIQLDQKNKELNKLFNELQQKEGQLIHSEKMASLGHLVAGISHELNNPISFIYANTKALENYLSEIEELWTTLKRNDQGELNSRFKEVMVELGEIIRDNINGSKSVKDLVLNLKNFSRLDQADWKETHLVDGIESSLKILKPEITEAISVVKRYNTDPFIHCNPGQLNQVFLNLLSNAVQAMPDGGQLTISTDMKMDVLVIEVGDSGSGIPVEIQKKIFDPFFTTKDVNKGSGLGLSISYTIVQGHKGKLSVQSKPGAGSVFRIELPIKPLKTREPANE